MVILLHIWDNLAIWYHTQPAQDWAHGHIVCFRVRISQGSPNSSQNRNHTPWRFYPDEGVPTGGVLALACSGLKINELPSGVATNILRAIFVDDLAIYFRERSLDTIERHLQLAVNAIPEWAAWNGLRFAVHKCKVIHFYCTRSKVPRPPAIRIGDTFLPVEDSTKFLGLWLDSHFSFKKRISVLKAQCREALNLLLSGCALEVGRGLRHTPDTVPGHYSL